MEGAFRSYRIRCAAALAVIGCCIHTLPAQADSKKLERLVERLEHADASKRIAAIDAIAALGSSAAAAIPALVTRLADPSSEVGAAASRAVAAMGDSAVGALRTAVRDLEGRARLLAVASLARRGARLEGSDAESAEQAIRTSANAEDAVMRREAIRAIATLPVPGAPTLDALVAALEDDVEQVQGQAQDALRRLATRNRALVEKLMASGKLPRSVTIVSIARQAGHVPLLATLCQSGPIETRVAAFEAFGLQGWRALPYEAKFEAYCKDESPQIRAAALKMIGQITRDDEAHFARVEAALRDAEASVRLAALQYVQSCWLTMPPSLATLLAEQLRTPELREAASKALSRLGRDARDAIDPFFTDRDPNIRRAAVLALEGYAWNERETLEKMLEDKEPSVVAASLEIIGYGWFETHRFSKYLKHRNREIRRGALLGLGNLWSGASDAVPMLIKELSRKNRADAARALGRIGANAQRAVPKLANLTGHRDREVRLAAIEALGSIGEAAAKARSKLVKRLKDDDKDVRIAAIRALSQLGKHSESVVPKILALITEDKQAGWTAANAIAELGKHSQKAVRKATEMLDDPAVPYRNTIASALGTLGPAAADSLETILRLAAAKHEQTYLRTSAIRAATTIADKAEAATTTVLNALESLATDTSSSVRSAALDGFATLGTRAAEFESVVIRGLEDRSESVRKASARALPAVAKTVPGQAVDTLQPMLEAENPGIHAAAARAIARAGVPGTRVLVNALTSKDSNVIRAAVFGIEALGTTPSTAVDALIQHATVNDSRVRSAIGRCLARVEGILPRLDEVAATDDQRVHFVAIAAAEKLGAPARGLLEKLASDGNELVQARARAAIERLPEDR